MKDISIEYAHIYTNNHIGEEQKLSLEILEEVKNENQGSEISLVVMVDDYSFPDPTFDYDSFTSWLASHQYNPDLVLRESQLIPSCDEVLNLIENNDLKSQIVDYIKSKKYPCSLFIATWYLIRLGHIESPLFNKQLSAKTLINILPKSFKPFEEKAFEIISYTKYNFAVNNITNKYFEGRLVA